MTTGAAPSARSLWRASGFAGSAPVALDEQDIPEGSSNDGEGLRAEHVAHHGPCLLHLMSHHRLHGFHLDRCHCCLHVLSLIHISEPTRPY